MTQPRIYKGYEKLTVTAAAAVSLTVPAGAASQFSLALSTALNAFCANPTWKTLQQLLLLPRVALQIPPKSGKGH